MAYAKSLLPYNKSLSTTKTELSVDEILPKCPRFIEIENEVTALPTDMSYIYVNAQVATSSWYMAYIIV